MRQGKRRLGLGWLLIVAAVASCGGESIDGRYKVTATNGGRTCGLPGWNADAVIEGVVFVQQDGDEAYVEFRGELAEVVSASGGSTLFFADEVHQKLDYWVSGGCDCECQRDVEFTFHAEISDGEIRGDLQYRLDLDVEPTCADGPPCSARQQLIGTRLD